MVDDDRVIWNIIGEPPESPQGYAARTGVTEDQIPHSIFKNWRTWNTKEQALVEKASESMSGQSTDDILKSLGYSDEADKGKSMFARYRSGEKAGVLENIAGDAFQTAVGRGHMTWDPTRNQYINMGTSTDPNRPDQVWDKDGKIVQGKSTGWGAAISGQGTIGKAPVGFGGQQPYGMMQMQMQQPTGPKRGDAGYRPMLRTDANNSNFGSWGTSYGRPQKIGSAAQRQPGNTFQYQPGMGNPGY